MSEQLTLNEIAAAVVAIERNCKERHCLETSCDMCSYGNASRKLLAMADEIKAKEAGRALVPETTTVPRERLADLERLAKMVVEAPCGGVDDPNVYHLARKLTKDLPLFDWRERR